MKPARAFLVVAGGALLVIAALTSSAGIEHALLGHCSGTLGCGPSLFRLLLAWHGAILLVVASRRRPAHRGYDAGAQFGDRTATGVNSSAFSGWLWLGLLCIIALTLRAWKLNAALWLDEILTLTDYVRMPLGRILTSLPNQNQHMLYSVLAHGSVGIFGESAWSLRLPAVFFGIGSIVALYLLGRRVLSTREALLACALMTLSYHHIWFSQNARGYSGLLCFAILSTWLWLEARERNTWTWWAGYVLTVVAGMSLHMTMAFVVAAHGVAYLFELAGPRGRAAWWQPLVAWFLAVTLTAQLFALALPEFHKYALHEPSMKSTWTDPRWVIQESLRHLKLGFGLIAALAASLLVFAGWLSLLRTNWRPAMLLVLPVILAGGVTIASGHNIWPRFFFFAMGFALLIVIRGATTAARGMLAILGRSRDDRAVSGAGTVLAAAIIGASAMTVPRCYALPKQDFGGAREYVERMREPQDAVVSVGLAAKAYARSFAPQWTNIESYPPTPGVRPLTLRSYCEEGHCRCGPKLERIMQDHATVWLVYTLEPELQAFHPALHELVRKEFRVLKVFPGSLSGGEITICRYDRTTP